MDSAATSHMTNDKTLHLISHASQAKNVYLANDKTVKVFGKGALRLFISIEKKKRTILLKDVLYVPELQANLIPISKICATGDRVVFNAINIK